MEERLSREKGQENYATLLLERLEGAQHRRLAQAARLVALHHDVERHRSRERLVDRVEVSADGRFGAKWGSIARSVLVEVRKGLNLPGNIFG